MTHEITIKLDGRMQNESLNCGEDSDQGTNPYNFVYHNVKIFRDSIFFNFLPE